MPEENSAIAIIPGECFRWQPRVQFIESFLTRAAALNYASQYGYSLIVARNEGSSAIFDVMKDPDGACTADLDLELLKTEDALVEPPTVGWSALMLSTVWHLARWLAVFVAIPCGRKIIPISRRAAALAGTYLREMVPISRRAAALASAYLRKITPISRRVTTIASLYLRKIAPLSRRTIAAIASLYQREFAPICCRVGSVARMYFRGIAPLYRRVAAFVSLYFQEVAPILRNAAVRCWSDSKGVSRRHSWTVAAPHHPDPSQPR